MPQMAPINWLSLYMLFCLIFILFNIMNYFMFNYKTKNYSFKKSLKLNWKW
uniref:ATP synthase complex subunit 8 n=1 Tax=Eurysternus sp. KM-2017 TaxID=2219492 RepID=A0A346RGV5_9SCAR|nr:ATP synthase F0 subunit 8 [Eurysternus sp. KM-2017]